MSTLEKAAQGELTVLAVDRKQRRRNPAPPFTTSTLQQEASRKLGFSAQKTMRVAQQLYEGVDIGEGAVGLITYMRTDSLNLAQEAIGADPRGHRQALRPGGTRRGSARLSHQVGRTPRKPTRRSVRPMRASCRPTSRSKLDGGSVPPVLADLEAHRGLPDGARGIRHRRGRAAGRRRWCESARCCAPTARRWSSPATYRSTRKAWTTSCRTIRITCCRR